MHIQPPLHSSDTALNFTQKEHLNKDATLCVFRCVL